MLTAAKETNAEHGLRPWTSCEAFNEWLEGSYLEPSTEWGFSYLEAKRPPFPRKESAMKQIVPILLLCLALASAVGAEDGIPHDSKIARATQGWQRLLLNPLDDTSSVATGAWKMKGTYVIPFLSPKLGWTALALGATAAEQAGAKGDFRVRETVPGETRTIGLWVHLAEDSNVVRMGVQVYDSQNEVLLAMVPAEWTGWRWVEADLAMPSRRIRRPTRTRPSTTR